MRSIVSGGVGLASIAIALVAMPARAVTESGRLLQCWTDERGVRACGDHVPPQYAKSQRELIDSRGQVVKVLPKQRTEAEQAEYEREQAAKRKAEDDARQQRARDAFLLQSYRNVGELGRARDERLASVDARLSLAERSQTSTAGTLKELEDRADGLQKTGKPVPDDLAKSLASFRQARGDNDAALRRLHDEREQTAAQFATDIERYRSLRGLPPAADAPSSKPPTPDKPAR